MHRSALIAGFASTIVMTCALNSQASAPGYITDMELAEYPVIVVARWNKADFRSHCKYQNDDPASHVVTEIEAFTTLEVLRTIKGNVKPGDHPLMLGWGIGWDDEGTRVNSGTSTWIDGDVSDITTSNIWFLKLEKSWDEKDKAQYLSISHYRAIQPLGLEQYFVALRSRHPDREVPKLLKSEDPEVIYRVLFYISGGCLPWPYDSHADYCGMRPEERGKVLYTEAEAVINVISKESLNNIRPEAIAVYAELTGGKCGPYIAGLLTDKTPNARGMAIAVLAHIRNEQAIPKMIPAVNGVTNGWMACKIIEAVRSWGDSRLAPVMISFLQNDEYGETVGDDLGLPAIKARAALQEMTGHVFPYDVATSRAAWDKVGSMTNTEERKNLLVSLIPCDPMPLQVDLIGSPQKASLRIRNGSNQAVTVAKHPSCVNQRGQGISGHYCYVTGTNDFLTLHPGESVQSDVKLEDLFLLADPSMRAMTVEYVNNGSDFGINAWIGTIPVSIGINWTEERKIETVEETWPNGNLKTRGQIFNGQKYGEWSFFNEDGDRIEIIDYASNTSQRGSTKCNPDHPSNKGAGKKKKTE